MLKTFPWKVGSSLALLGALGVLFLFDPTQYAIYPACLFHKLTGWNCPACGSLRALHHLVHGRLTAAFHCNPLLIAAMVLIFWVAACRVWSSAFKRSRTAERPEGETPNLPLPGWLTRPSSLWLAIAAVIAFGVLRNLPFAAFAWMSP